MRPRDYRRRAQRRDARDATIALALILASALGVIWAILQLVG